MSEYAGIEPPGDGEDVRRLRDGMQMSRTWRGGFPMDPEKEEGYRQAVAENQRFREEQQRLRAAQNRREAEMLKEAGWKHISSVEEANRCGMWIAPLGTEDPGGEVKRLQKMLDDEGKNV